MSSGRSFVLALTACAALAAPVQGQTTWTADVYAGGTRYGALAALSDALAIVANLRLSTPHISAFASAAAPLNGDSPAWTALGGAVRPTRAFGHIQVGASLAADGFLFRQFDNSTGAGGSAHVLPLIGFARGAWSAELHGGRRDYGLTGDAGRLRRHVYEVGGRLTSTLGPLTPTVRFRSVRVPQGDARHVATVEVSAGTGALSGWATAGQWFGAGSDTEWSVGAAYDTGSRGQVWAAVQRSGLDPLYLTPSRTSWNIGYSLALGRPAVTSVPAPELRDGMLVIRLTGSASGPVFVAGEFSGWSLLPMVASGAGWELAVPITSGVTRFSFVDQAGDWFVPEGYPGRIEDDMGGHVVIVVVP